MVRKKNRPISFNATPIKLKCSESIKIHLQHFERSVKISASSCSQKYKIGEIPIVLHDVCDGMDSVISYLHFKEDSTRCFLWWEEANDSEKQVKFSFATCEVPYNVLNALTCQNQFHLIWETVKFQSKNTCVNVYINSNLIVPLMHASEPHVNRFRSKVQTIVSHFYGIAVEEYGKDFIDEEDHLEKVYECFKNRFNPNERVVEVSHPHLIPKLRDYQSQAVHWMLKCENSSKNEPRSHVLYSKLLLSDGSELYYHMYGGFFVTEQFTSLPPAKGGILADEMGLGKTVEVLACILLHSRREFISQDEQIIVARESCAAKVSKDISEDAGCSIKAKRKKNPPVINEIMTNNSKRQKTNCNSFQDEKTMCRKCSLLLDVSKTPSDFSFCSMCSEDAIDPDSQSTRPTNVYNGKEDSKNTKKDFSGFEKESVFECVCGSAINAGKSNKTVVQCKNCGLQQHAECVLANVSEESFVNYLCPYCWVEPSMEPAPSPATLIVSPSAILHQWEQEISRHIKKDCLKVFMYAGIEHHKFINPKVLANYDIVLSSYETFRKELSHVNVPHGKNQRPLRHPKKFRTLPSPLSAIEWWRICLDEAQMVESVTTKSSQMALQLKCVNRWCVTGTPIQKSVKDLYGLLLFLRTDPYNQKLWWKELLWKPFACGSAEKLSFVLNNVLWRTPKNDVLLQMGVPQQEILVHTMQLSQIEKVFYESIRFKCLKDFLENIRKYDCEYLSLQNMDKHVLSNILLPMKKLQKACCHFQLVQSNLADIHKKKMTIPELLNHLLKNTSYECEEVHRKLVLALNGVAGVFAIEEDYENCCRMYKNVLLSVEEHRNVCRTDILQQIHTLHNYSELLSLWTSKTNDDSEIKILIERENVLDFIEELKSKSKGLCETYLQKFIPILKRCKFSLKRNALAISKIKSEFICRQKYNISWWNILLNALNVEEAKQLVKRIRDSLSEAPGRNFLSVSISEWFNDCYSLKLCLTNLEKELYMTRYSLIDTVRNITVTPDPNLLNSSIECHLRPTPENTAPRCLYCKANEIFSQYEAKLFCFNKFSESNDVSYGVGNICFPKLRKGTHADNEFELTLKILANYARNAKDLSSIYLKDATNQQKLFAALKKEFKDLRSIWIEMSEYIKRIDELEMAKMSMRLLSPGETLPSPVSYIIQVHELESNKMQLQSDIISHQYLLKKKLGQLFYLQNLKKSQNSDVPFEETCPVCQRKLEISWSVLQCGHSYCLDCIHTLSLPTANALRTPIRCPVCREVIYAKDIYYIDVSLLAKEEISIKGSYSTKVSAIVKCLLIIKKKDPSAKSLVFSTWTDFLYLLEDALTENEMAFVSTNNKKPFQENLELFKQSSNINVILLPLNVGANGLNIIEATNVLLTEPVLDNSKVLQAIGRVHRIGQTRETVVHKFVISSTIEENIYKIHNDLSSKNLGNLMTVNDLRSLFDEK